jgi:hypothetical protein
MMLKRYYYRWEDNWNGWYVYDREQTDPAGDAEAICGCITRDVASMVTDALNEADTTYEWR